MTMAHMSDVEKMLGKEVVNTMQDSALNGEISDDGMGWDKLSVLVSPPLKNLLKGPPPSLRSITATLVSRVIPRSKFPHSLIYKEK